MSQNAFDDWHKFLKQHLKNQEDTAAWDKNLLQRDIDDSVANKKGKPFPHGAFPVPRYELASNYRYKGAGAGGNYKNYYGTQLICHWFSKIKSRLRLKS